MAPLGTLNLPPVQPQAEEDNYGNISKSSPNHLDCIVSRSPTPVLQESGIDLINPEVTRHNPNIAIPPQTFPNFLLLPPEIRLQVYERALPCGATITRAYNATKLRYGLRRTVPPILQACRESRYSFMATGPTDMRRMPFEMLSLCPAERGVYVEWARDSLFISRGFNIPSTELSSYSRIRFLVMDWGLRPCWVQTSIPKGVTFTRQFPALEILTLLVEFNQTECTLSQASLLRAKKKKTREIAQAVRAEFDAQKMLRPWWTLPELRVVHKTDYWRKQPHFCRC